MAENLVFGLFLLLPVACGAGLVYLARRLRGREHSLKWPLVFAGNLMVLFFLLSLGTLAGEAYYRFIYDTTDSLDYTKVSERWFRRHWQSNPSGCRDNINYSKKIEPGKRRITFVGDSFTAGHGIKEVNDRFANRIRRAHPEWEIHLLAQPGLDTGDEQKYLENCLRQGYQLDQVVLVYCLNDVSDMLPEWTNAVAHIYAESDQSGWFRHHSYVVNTLYHRFNVWHNPFMKQYFNFVLDGYRGALWQQQQQRLIKFRQSVESQGGRLSVVTFPFVQSVGPHYEFRFAHQELAQFWREQKVPHLDLLPLYDNLPARKITVNRFDAHPNEYAHALAAEQIDKFLQQVLANEPAPMHLTNSPPP